MCGRYAQFTSPEAIAELFGAIRDIADVGPRYTAAPMQ
ncbi:SOS response-associated peptidase [Thiocapsa rosea]|nr:SOS response-associated peptidase [Thiocapsa rosea]